MNNNEYSVKSIKGHRDYMEDRWNYVESSNRTTIVALVADGHGGDQIADLTAKQLPQLLIKAVEKSANIATSKAVAIKTTIEKWGFINKQEKSGCTLTGFVKNGGNYYIFNVGDSRTLVHLQPNSYIYYLTPDNTVQISKGGFLETRDHTPDLPQEVDRVFRNGGKISGGRLNGILSVTKALGDYGVGPGLCYSPDVFWVDSSKVNGRVIVLFSDGIYDGFSKTDGEVYKNHFLYHLGEKFGADGLVNWAYSKMGSGDNITALVVAV